MLMNMSFRNKIAECAVTRITYLFHAIFPTSLKCLHGLSSVMADIKFCPDPDSQNFMKHERSKEMHLVINLWTNCAALNVLA